MSKRYNRLSPPLSRGGLSRKKTNIDVTEAHRKRKCQLIIEKRGPRSKSAEKVRGGMNSKIKSIRQTGKGSRKKKKINPEEGMKGRATSSWTKAETASRGGAQAGAIDPLARDNERKKHQNGSMWGSAITIGNGGIKEYELRHDRTRGGTLQSPV